MLHPESPDGVAEEIESVSEALSEYRIEITESSIEDSERDDREIVELKFSLEGGEFESEDMTFYMQEAGSDWMVYRFSDE